VVGAARSGIAAAELLVRRGARVILSETRSGFDGMEQLEALGVQLELGGHVPETLAQADLVVTSPGVALEQPAFASARQRGVEIVGELELASRWVQGRIIAITGTKGKSTTTTLVGRMLNAAGRTALVGGNIGVPLSAQVGASTAETIHVVEASSFQLEATVTFRPWIALWLNLADDHLDRHADAGAYAAAKARIFANQQAEDFAVLNAEDSVVRELGTRGRAQQVWFAPAAQITEGFVVDGKWIARRTGTSVDPLIPTDAVELKGRHMLGNVVAAAAVSWLAGVDAHAMTTALRGFRGLEHAMEPAGEIGGVGFVNDSKATNVEAACRSIESFGGGVVAIIGAWWMPGVTGQSTGQPSTKNGEWTHYTADVKGSKYMPLDQINAANFNKLEVAWRFSTANLGPRPEFNLEGTPLMVKGVVYATGGGGGRRSEKTGSSI